MSKLVLRGWADSSREGDEQTPLSSSSGDEEDRYEQHVEVFDWKKKTLDAMMEME